MESMDSNWEWYEKRDDTDGWYHSDVLSCADTSSFVWTQKLEVWWIFLWLAPINILEFLVRWHYALKIVSWIITFFFVCDMPSPYIYTSFAMGWTLFAFRTASNLCGMDSENCWKHSSDFGCSNFASHSCWIAPPHPGGTWGKPLCHHWYKVS